VHTPCSTFFLHWPFSCFEEIVHFWNFTNENSVIIYSP